MLHTHHRNPFGDSTLIVFTLCLVLMILAACCKTTEPEREEHAQGGGGGEGAEGVPPGEAAPSSAAPSSTPHSTTSQQPTPAATDSLQLLANAWLPSAARMFGVFPKGFNLVAGISTGLQSAAPPSSASSDAIASLRRCQKLYDDAFKQQVAGHGSVRFMWCPLGHLTSLLPSTSGKPPLPQPWSLHPCHNLNLQCCIAAGGSQAAVRLFFVVQKANYRRGREVVLEDLAKEQNQLLQDIEDTSRLPLIE